MHPPALALDFGRVLTLDQDQSLFGGLLSRTKLSDHGFRRSWEDWRLDYDKGLLDKAAYWSRVLGAEHSHLTDEFAEADYQSWNQPRTALHKIVQRALDQGTPAAVVSNMPPGLGDRFASDWPWLRRIPFRFFSGEFGLVKPDPSFYSHLVNVTGWDPARVLFVDDVPANVEGASKAGFATLLFSGSTEDLETVGRWCGLPALDTRGPDRP